MHYKITIFGNNYYLHRLSRKERKMTCHQNPGSGYNIEGDRSSVVSQPSCRMDVTLLEQRTYLKIAVTARNKC